MIGAAVADYRGRVAVIDLAEAYWRFGDRRLQTLRSDFRAYRANLLNPFVLQILMQQSRHASAACRQLTAALSNFVADAPNVVGFDPWVNFADYLERRAGLVPAAEAA